jgi:hypothetical protein
METGREVEKELMEFMNSLHHDMSEKEVVALFDSLQREHYIAESKLILVKTVFHKVLDAAFEKEDQPKGIAELPMFH